MIKTKLGIFFLMLGLFSNLSTSYADDARIPLFTATSDAFDGSLAISLTVDQNSNATGFAYTSDKKDTVLPLANLSQGITLYQTEGENVVVLSSKTFDATSGGPLTLTYLHDGISDIYKTFDFALGRSGQNWTPYVANQNGIPQSFITMYLTAKKVFGKVIGIDTITVK